MAEIQNGVSSQCAINADVTSETYEDIATGKLHLWPTISTTAARFKDALAKNAFEYLEMIYIERNLRH